MSGTPTAAMAASWATDPDESQVGAGAATELHRPAGARLPHRGRLVDARASSLPGGTGKPRDWSTPMEATMLFVAVTVLILLAVTSTRFGVDNREGFASKERELARHGIV